MKYAFILSILLATSAEAKIPDLIVQGSGSATSYANDGNCFSAQDDQLAEQVAERNATTQCMAKNGGISVQYTKFVLSHESTENPRPYGFTCTTIAQASYICDNGH